MTDWQTSKSIPNSNNFNQFGQSIKLIHFRFETRFNKSELVMDQKFENKLSLHVISIRIRTQNG